MFEDLKIPDDLMPIDPRFGVGPSKIPVTFLKKLVDTGTNLLGTSHRQPSVIRLVEEIHQGFRTFFNLPSDYEIIIGNGGATFFFDMIGTGLVKKSSVHFTTGEFSTKWFKSHSKIPWIHATQKSTEFGQGLNPEILDDHDMICTTLNETSTGVIVNKFPDVRDSDRLLCVDATSAAGQLPIDMSFVDCYFFSPQKVFAGEGGLYIAFLSPKAVSRALEINELDRYIPEIMSWKYAIEKGRLFQTYNTPSITNLFYINEQLKEMNTLGEGEVFNQSLKKANLIYNWAKSKDYLSIFVDNDSFRSTSVAVIDVDDKYSVSELAQALREQDVAYDIEGYRKMGRNQLRISLFHNIDYRDLVSLTKVISFAIESELNK